MSGETDCPIVVLSWISRAAENRKNHRPVITDMTDSSTIGEVADVVLLLYRDEYYRPNSRQKSIIEVIAAKSPASYT